MIEFHPDAQKWQVELENDESKPKKNIKLNAKRLKLAPKEPETDGSGDGARSDDVSQGHKAGGAAQPTSTAPPGVAKGDGSGGVAPLNPPKPGPPPGPPPPLQDKAIPSPYPGIPAKTAADIA